MMRYWITFGSAILAVIIACVVLWQNGAAWRIPEHRMYPSKYEMRSFESSFCQGTDNIDGVELGGKPNEPLITCSHDKKSNQDIYVWGDSHARHLLPGLVSAYPTHNIHILYLTSCPSQSGIGKYIFSLKNKTVLKNACIDRNRRALQFFQSLPPTSIIIHQYFGYDGQFSADWYGATSEIIDQLENRNHNVAILGGVPRPGVSLAACLVVPTTIPDWLIQRRCRGNPKLSQKIVVRNKDLKGRFPRNVIDISSVFCTEGGSCIGTDGSNLLFRDKHHLTLFGSKRLINAIKPNLSSRLEISNAE